MAKKVMPPPGKPRRGTVVIRNADLDAYQELKRVAAEELDPPLKAGPAASQAFREWVERRKR